MPHVFISYAWKDGGALARQLHSSLNARDGWSAWMDDKLHADTVFSHELQNQIDRADLCTLAEVQRREDLKETHRHTCLPQPGSCAASSRKRSRPAASRVPFVWLAVSWFGAGPRTAKMTEWYCLPNWTTLR